MNDLLPYSPVDHMFLEWTQRQLPLASLEFRPNHTREGEKSIHFDPACVNSGDLRRETFFFPVAVTRNADGAALNSQQHTVHSNSCKHIITILLDTMATNFFLPAKG